MAKSSVWANVQNLEQPLEAQTPSVWAPIDQEQVPTVDTAAKPMVNHAGGPAFGEGPSLGPAMSKPITNTQPEMQAWRDELQKLETPKTPFKELDTAHKIGRVFSTLGNVAGNIVAPNVMANIPGTEMYNREREGQLAKRLDTEVQHEAENKERGAQAGYLGAETRTKEAELPYVPQQQETGIAQKQAQTGFENQQAEELRNPPSQVLPYMTTGGPEPEPIQFFPKEHRAEALDLAGGVQPFMRSGEFAQTAGVDSQGVQHKALFDKVRGLYVDADTRLPIPGFKPLPQAYQVPPWMYDPTGNDIFRPTPGKPLPHGVTTPTQLGQGNEKEVQETAKTQHDAIGLDGTVATMNTLARQHTGPADFGILMAFAGAAKPESVGKLRWQKAEQDYIEGLRNTYGDINAWGKKIESGERLTDQQKAEMIKAVRIIQQQKAMDSGLQQHDGSWWAKEADGQWHRQ